MADFVIVGGGVYGCGAAWQLAKQGAEVLLLEANSIAGGASGGLGKRGVRANGRDPRELPLMHMAYDIWPNLHEELDGFTGYERTGHLLLFEREHDFLKAPARAWLQNQKGIPSRLVGQEELREMEPYVGETVQAALFCPKDGVADHTATTRSLAQAARRAGAEIREGTAVTNLEWQGDRITAVVTATEERIPVTHTLLLLANRAVPQLVQDQLGLTLPIWWWLPQVMLTNPIDPMPLRYLIGHAHRVLALKSNPGGEIMVSGGWRGRWNPETSKGETEPEQVAGNLAEAVAVYPCLAGIGVQEATADRWETETIDNIPIIARLPGADNMIIGTGWSGHGWAISPAVTQLIAQWALSGQQPDLLRPFDYSRFL